MNAQDFLRRLNPIGSGGLDAIYGIMLYTILLLSLIFLFRQTRPNQAVMLLMVAQMVFIIVDKVAVGTFSGALLRPKAFETFILRACIFIFPLLCAGITRSPKSRPLGLMSFGVAATYFLIRGFTDFGFFQNMGIQFILLFR
jgi:hypothetical protein